MQTTFTDAQLADPLTRRSNEILRSCVHCGFCTATCPTYKVLGDELDSPRGRIYLIKDMLENSRVPDEATVTHIDRCLSCLSCMTTCPSGVNYMHLVDHAREYINENYRRRWDDRALRWLLARVLPYPGRFRLALGAEEEIREMLRAFEPEAVHISTEGPIGIATRRICVEWKLPFTTTRLIALPAWRAPGIGRAHG